MVKLETILAGKTIKYNAKDSDVTNYITKNRQDLDYASIFDINRVAFFGERHTVLSDKQEIIDNLPSMKNAGLTHLALEMLSSSKQGIIDRFYELGDNKEQVFSYFKEHWGSKGEGVAEKYMEMVETAKKLGIKIIALDIDSKEYKSKSPSDTFEKRNIQWADLTAQQLKKDENSKVLIYHGSAHSGYYPINNGANNELKKLGYDSIAIKFCGAEIFDKEYVKGISEMMWSHNDYVAKSAIELNLQNKRFITNIDKSTSRSGDLYIHLPQIENDVI